MDSSPKLSLAQPMLWALCRLGLGSRFLRPEAQAQAQAFNPFILHMYPPVLWHDPTGRPPDVWELNISFFFVLCRSCLVTSSHAARPYGPTLRPRCHPPSAESRLPKQLNHASLLPPPRTSPYDHAV